MPSTTPAIERREIDAEGVCNATPRIQAEPELKAQPKTAFLHRIKELTSTNLFVEVLAQLTEKYLSKLLIIIIAQVYYICSHGYSKFLHFVCRRVPVRNDLPSFSFPKILKILISMEGPLSLGTVAMANAASWIDTARGGRLASQQVFCAVLSFPMRALPR